MQESRYAFSTDKGYDEILKSITPIELPSDEEIKSYSDRYSTIHEDVSDKLGKYLVSAIHIDGAKWMKEQILTSNGLENLIGNIDNWIEQVKQMEKEKIIENNKLKAIVEFYEQGCGKEGCKAKEPHVH